jgi:hypothetical protein
MPTIQLHQLGNDGTREPAMETVLIEVSTMLRILKNDLISGRILDEHMALALRNLLEDNDLGEQFYCFVED